MTMWFEIVRSPVSFGTVFMTTLGCTPPVPRSIVLLSHVHSVDAVTDEEFCKRTVDALANGAARGLLASTVRCSLGASQERASRRGLLPDVDHVADGAGDVGLTLSRQRLRWRRQGHVFNATRPR